MGSWTSWPNYIDSEFLYTFQASLQDPVGKKLGIWTDNVIGNQYPWNVAIDKIEEVHKSFTVSVDGPVITNGFGTLYFLTYLSTTADAANPGNFQNDDPPAAAEANFYESVTGRGLGAHIDGFILKGADGNALPPGSYTISSDLPGISFPVLDAAGQVQAYFGSISATNSMLHLEWSPQGMKLQQSSTPGTGTWQDVPGMESTNSATLSIQGGQAFFRLASP